MTSTTEPVQTATAPRTRSRTKLIALVALGVVVVAIVALVFYLPGRRYVVELTEDQLQTGVNAIFPVEKPYLLLLTLTLSDPQVRLIEGADRISFSTRATLNLRVEGQEKSLGGQGTVTTGLRYHPENYSFYLDDPQLEKLEVQGLPVKYVGLVNDLARKLAAERISSTRIYTLRPTDLKRSTARLILKGLTVRNQRLVVELGW